MVKGRLSSPAPVLFAFATLLLAYPSARSDTVLTVRAESFRNLKITAFNQARLEAVEKKTGKRTLFDFDQIAVIRVDEKNRLNDAERFLMIKEYDKAVDAYQVVLADTAGGWERIWIQVRLLRLYGRAGKLDEAAQTFIDLAGKIPEWILQVAPQGEDLGGDEKLLKKATAKLLQARNVHASAKSREALTRFLERLGYDQPALLLTEKPVEKITESELMTSRRPPAWLDAWAERKIAAGEIDLVVRTTEELFKTAVRADLPAVIYWQGRVMLAQGEYDPAALSFLRVALEFPRSKHAPYALHYAAQAMSKAPRPGYARRIRKELIAGYGSSSDLIVSQWIDEAREALKASSERGTTEDKRNEVQTRPAPRIEE